MLAIYLKKRLERKIVSISLQQAKEALQEACLTEVLEVTPNLYNN